MNKGGGNRIISGGVQSRSWGGALWYVFHSPEFPPPCFSLIVAHVCGDPPLRYTCRATLVAADFLRILAFFRCSGGIALHTPNLPCRTCRPSTAGGVARQAASEKVSRYRGCSSYTCGCRATTVATMMARRNGRDFPQRWRHLWETDFYPVPVLGRIALSL